MAESYHVHISKFEGPLDLLLHLIESAEVDIKDIFVSEITTQYLTYMEEIQDLDMDTASDFISMAATLLYIKSRQLLPRPPKEETTEEDPEVLLIRQLREYQLFKKASGELLNLEGNTIGSFTKLPEDFILPDQEIALSDATAKELYKAFFTLLHAQPEEQQPHPLQNVKLDVYTVRNRIAVIKDVLMDFEEHGFEELFGKNPYRIEIIVTFMALMELLSRAEIELKQSGPFSPIRLRARESLLMANQDTEYMDEYAE